MDQDSLKPCIVEEHYPKWLELVHDTISLEPGEHRDYGIFLLEQIERVLRALNAGLDPGDAISAVSPETSLIQIGEVIQAVVRLSPRGEEFRVWWNKWHEREHPQAVYNPACVTFNGRRVMLIGTFDSKTPLTKSPLYPELVKTAVDALKLAAQQQKSEDRAKEATGE